MKEAPKLTLMHVDDDSLRGYVDIARRMIKQHPAMTLPDEQQKFIIAVMAVAAESIGISVGATTVNTLQTEDETREIVNSQLESYLQMFGAHYFRGIAAGREWASEATAGRIITAVKGTK